MWMSRMKNNSHILFEKSWDPKEKKKIEWNISDRKKWNRENEITDSFQNRNINEENEFQMWNFNRSDVYWKKTMFMKSKLWKVLKRNIFWKDQGMRDESESISEVVGMNLYWFPY